MANLWSQQPQALISKSTLLWQSRPVPLLEREAWLVWHHSFSDLQLAMHTHQLGLHLHYMHAREHYKALDGRTDRQTQEHLYRGCCEDREDSRFINRSMLNWVCRTNWPTKNRPFLSKQKRQQTVHQPGRCLSDKPANIQIHIPSET